MFAVRLNGAELDRHLGRRARKGRKVEGLQRAVRVV